MNDNPGSYSSADTAYLLAYSTIMLNVDAHSAKIKKKMAKEEFVKQHVGYKDSDPLLKIEAVEAIYDDIVANEIKLDDENKKAPNINIGKNNKEKITMYVKDAEAMIKKTQEKAKQLAVNEGLRRASTVSIAAELNDVRSNAMFVTSPPDYFTSTQPGIARSVFLAMAWPVMASFGMIMEHLVSGHAHGTRREAETANLSHVGDPYADDKTMMNDNDVVIHIVNGMAYAIRVACLTGCDTERDVFMKALYTYAVPESHKVCTVRHAIAFLVLCDVAMSNANMLGKSWLHVLKAVSEWDRLREQEVLSGGPTTMTYVIPALHNSLASGIFVEEEDDKGRKKTKVNSMMCVSCYT